MGVGLQGGNELAESGAAHFYLLREFVGGTSQCDKVGHREIRLRSDCSQAGNDFGYGSGTCRTYIGKLVHRAACGKQGLFNSEA